MGSNNGTAKLSPVIDFSGTQVAFVETVGTESYLVLLRMTLGGSVTSPTTANHASSAGNYFTGTNCAAPCYYYFGLGTSTTDSNSPPFYDYSHDTIYVGDDAGVVHQFTTVLRGTPTPGSTSTSVGSRTLTGPVVDPIRRVDLLRG